MLSRLVTALVNRLFGTHPVLLSGDFSALAHKLLGRKALAGFNIFGSSEGVSLNAAKSEVVHMATFMGLRGCLPCAENRYALHISPRLKNRTARAVLLGDFVAKWIISHQDLEKLIGRLSFSQPLLFG